MSRPVADMLGDEAATLLDYRCRGIDAASLYLPGPDFVDRVWSFSNRPPRVLRALQTLFGHGRLGGSVPALRSPDPVRREAQSQ